MFPWFLSDNDVDIAMPLRCVGCRNSLTGDQSFLVRGNATFLAIAMHRVLPDLDLDDLLHGAVGRWETLGLELGDEVLTVVQLCMRCASKVTPDVPLLRMADLPNLDTGTKDDATIVMKQADAGARE